MPGPFSFWTRSTSIQPKANVQPGQAVEKNGSPLIWIWDALAGGVVWHENWPCGHKRSLFFQHIYFRSVAVITHRLPASSILSTIPRQFDALNCIVPAQPQAVARKGFVSIQPAARDPTAV